MGTEIANVSPAGLRKAMPLAEMPSVWSSLSSAQLVARVDTVAGFLIVSHGEPEPERGLQFLPAMRYSKPI